MKLFLTSFLCLILIAAQAQTVDEIIQKHAATMGGLDAMNVISYADSITGFNLSSKVDPQLGKIGLALVVNEMMEPIRLPFVVATLKPVMDTINPPKF